MFDITSFGAHPGGTSDSSEAINAAVRAAGAAGGGTVVVPAGTYRAFSIQLLSHVELHLAMGAVLVAADSPRRGQETGEFGGSYDPAEPQVAQWEAYQDHGHNHWKNSLLWACDADQVAITGPGSIVGTGLSNGFAGGPGSEFDSEQPGVGNKAIALKNCRNVRLRDFSVVQGGWFAILLTGVHNVVVDGLCIDTNRDGIDVDCCRNVHISNCTVNSPWDDAICLKSSCALGRLVPTENVTITGCVVSGHYRMGSVADGTFVRYEGRPAAGNYLGGPTDPGNPRFCGRIKLGTESNGGFRSITIAACVFEGSDGLALESVDGGDCEDITVSNLTMREIVSGPLFVILGNRLRGPRGTRVGRMRRISIANVVASGVDPQHPSLITGTRGPGGDCHCIEDLKISHMVIEHLGGRPAATTATVPEFGSDEVGDYPDPAVFGELPAQGFVIRHSRHVDLHDVAIIARSTDARPVFLVDDVEGLHCEAVTITSADGRTRRALRDEDDGQPPSS